MCEREKGSDLIYLKYLKVIYERVISSLSLIHQIAGFGRPLPM